jgi:hypothetical protein
MKALFDVIGIFCIVLCIMVVVGAGALGDVVAPLIAILIAALIFVSMVQWGGI